MILDNAKIRKITVSNNGYYIFGKLEKSILIAKLSFQNKLLWAKKYSSENEIFLVDIVEDNGFIIRAKELVPSYKDNTLFLKINYDGKIEWNKIFGTEIIRNTVYKIISVKDGYIAFGMNAKNLWILKLSKDGNRVWENEYKYPRSHMYYYARHEQTNYVIYSVHTGLKKPTIKVVIDINGNIKEEKELPEVPVEIKNEHEKGSIFRKVINQNSYQFVKDEKNYVIQKSLDGKGLWEYRIKKEEIKSSRSEAKLLETNDGGCIILQVFSEGAKKISSKIHKLNKHGVLEWERYFPYNMITEALEVKNGQYVLIGYHSNMNASMDKINGTVKFSMSISNKKATIVFINEADMKKTTSTRNE